MFAEPKAKHFSPGHRSNPEHSSIVPYGVQRAGNMLCVHEPSVFFSLSCAYRVLPGEGPRDAASPFKLESSCPRLESFTPNVLFF